VNVLDLFSGIGGFSLGLERAGMRTIAFCEIDPFCRAVLRKHWPDVPVYDDVRTLTAARLVADANGQRLERAEFQRQWNGIEQRLGNCGIDLICGGFPCQDISVAGKGAGLKGERSGLWAEFARIIGEVRPRYVIVENVAALLSRGLGDVLGDLAALGYDAEWHCIPASAVGAPHRRDRLWIIAHARSVRCNARRSEQSLRRARQNGKAQLVFAFLADAFGFTGRPCGPGDADESARRRYAGRSSLGADDVPDTNGARRIEQRWGIAIREELAAAECADWWRAEPDVGRVAHGVPARVDRLRSLGNAVVPQIPEIIGRAIMMHAKGWVKP
jgi:DNA (cytosine-5)-methyltransferase 1